MEENEGAKLEAPGSKVGPMGKVDDDDHREAQSSGHGPNHSQKSQEATPLSSDMLSALTKLASKLCAICQRICRGEAKIGKDEPDSLWPGELEYHPSLPSLFQSVDAGCPLCTQLEQLFQDEVDKKPEILDFVDDSWCITCHPRSHKWFNKVEGLCFHFTFYASDGRPFNPIFDEIMCMGFYPAEFLRPGPEYLEYAAGVATKFSPNIELAQYWFRKCLDNCDCGHELGPKVLPSRLVKVGTRGGASSDIVARLCEKEDFSTDASYLTLSHCWGINPIFTLKKGNLETLKQGVPVNQLPDLFKDALYMTTQLGKEYIWIDCLCILQDCQDDWAYEAARMGDIYRYADCNLAASGYKDGKTSLFKERTPLPFLNFPLYLDRGLLRDTKTVDQDMGTLFQGIYISARENEFNDAVTKGPLNSRGWVAQERALSRRILHFTPERMWWECKNLVASESFPHISLSWNLGFDSGPNVLRSLSATTRIQEVYELWNKFVEFYAKTNLTVKTDRFPALIGIARAFGALTEDNLIAGFWERDIIQSLAWRAYHGAKDIPSTQIAPSWSWASLCIPHDSAYIGVGRINCYCTCRRIVSDDPDFRSDLNKTPFRESAVRGLEITGPLRKFPVKIESLPEISQWGEGVFHFNKYYDVADSSLFSAEDLDTHSWHWEKPTHMLPVTGSKSGEPYCDARCLLLSQVRGAEHPHTFRRLGVGHLWLRDEDTRSTLLGIDDSGEKSKPSTVFQDYGLQDLILV